MRKITILGMGQSAIERKHDILRYTGDSEIWGLNNGYLTYPHLKGKWARYFEMHEYRYIADKFVGKQAPMSYFNDLNALGCEIVTGMPLPMIENQYEYPFIDVCMHLDSNYFLGSPSLMLMLALYEHENGNQVDEIMSWGIDTQDAVHGQQRASWAFWCRAVRERGIKLTGTSRNFMAENENDEGLRGLREHIAQGIVERVNELKEKPDEKGD